MTMSGKELSKYYGFRYRANLKAELLIAYGGACKACGITDPDVLTLDHVNDDAYVEREYFGLHSRGGDKLYAKLKREGWPQDRFQLLCYNCNAKKEMIRRRALAITEREFADRTLVQARIGKQRNNLSGFKGVFWNSQKGKWAARIMINYRSVHLGFFDDIREAAKAYRKAAINQWGSDANVPTEEEIDKFEPKSMNYTADFSDL